MGYSYLKLIQQICGHGIVTGRIYIVLRTPETAFHTGTNIAIICWFPLRAIWHLVRQRIDVMLQMLHILYCQIAFICVHFSGLPNCIELNTFYVPSLKTNTGILKIIHLKQKSIVEVGIYFSLLLKKLRLQFPFSPRMHRCLTNL